MMFRGFAVNTAWTLASVVMISYDSKDGSTIPHTLVEHNHVLLLDNKILLYFLSCCRQHTYQLY